MVLHKSLLNSVRSGHAHGLFLTVLGVLILTPDSLLIRLIITDTWTLLFWRGFLQGLVILGFYVIRFGLDEAVQQFCCVGKAGVGIAVLYVGGNILFIQSIRLTYVANTLIILASAPLLGAIFSWLFLRERVSLITWIATVAGMAGIAVIFTGGTIGASLLGECLAFAAACFLAGSFVFIRGVKHINMIPAVAISGFMLALVAFPLADHPFDMSGLDVGYLLLLGAVVAPLSFALITLGPRTLTAPEVSLIMLLETVLGPVWVWLLLGEEPPPGTLIGGSIVLSVLVVHSVLELRKERIEIYEGS